MTDAVWYFVEGLAFVVWMAVIWAAVETLQGVVS